MGSAEGRPRRVLRRSERSRRRQRADSRRVSGGRRQEDRLAMGESPEEIKRQKREFWDQAAAQWERRRELDVGATSDLTDWLIDAVDPASGQTILDLAAGVGETGLAAAERIGEDG